MDTVIVTIIAAASGIAVAIAMMAAVPAPRGVTMELILERTALCSVLAPILTVTATVSALAGRCVRWLLAGLRRHSSRRFPRR